MGIEKIVTPEYAINHTHKPKPYRPDNYIEYLNRMRQLLSFAKQDLETISDAETDFYLNANACAIDNINNNIYGFSGKLVSCLDNLYGTINVFYRINMGKKRIKKQDVLYELKDINPKLHLYMKKMFWNSKIQRHIYELRHSNIHRIPSINWNIDDECFTIELSNDTKRYKVALYDYLEFLYNKTYENSFGAIKIMIKK